MLISLDIETYGLNTKALDGTVLPDQTVMCPARSIHTDRVPPHLMVSSVSITLPKTETVPGVELTLDELARLVPGDTFILYPQYPKHCRILMAWLRHADTLLGMNLAFDIGYLRATGFASALDERKVIIDLSVINYMYNEHHPQRSLKDIGPRLGTHVYTEEMLRKSFPDPRHPKHIEYACADTHNTMLAVAEIAKRIPRTVPDSPLLVGTHSEVQSIQYCTLVCLYMECSRHD